MGGNMFLLTGGSDCCLRDWRSGLTRFEAAKEMLSGGRSSLISVRTEFLISEPAKPVKALERSEAATSRALPR